MASSGLEASTSLSNLKLWGTGGRTAENHEYGSQQWSNEGRQGKLRARHLGREEGRMRITVDRQIENVCVGRKTDAQSFCLRMTWVGPPAAATTIVVL